MKFKYVRQKDSHGCAIACISMVTGIPYEKVVKSFRTNFNQDGMFPEVTRAYVCDQGFSAIEILAHGYNDVASTNKRMSRPFAEVHIVTVQPFADSTINHAIVMDRRGRVFDPDDPKSKDLTQYYSIIRVQGYFDDRTKK